MSRAIEIDSLSKTFPTASRPSLDGVSLSVESGEMVALIGASGSGKSTLLRHVAGLVAGDRTAGGVAVLGRPLQRAGRLSPNIRSLRANMGFVFQQFNLVDRLPVLTNVMTGALSRLPLWRTLLRWFPEHERLAAYRALCRVGIGAQALQRASTLSGGQQQRAAIARTLVQGAKIVLADEPIASLDPESSRRVMEILATINREDGITVVVSLHQVDYAVKFCRRVVALKDGRVRFDGPSASLTPALLQEIYGSELSWDGDHAPVLEPAFTPGAALAGARA
jgi:phosphonate transport system ATP-binding protein